MTDSRMNFQQRAPKIPPRILCIGMPVRDLTFNTPGVPGRGSKENATGFDEICGGNALNGAIGIVRLGGRASICGPMGDAKETSSRFIFEQMAHEGIETKHLIHMPGLVTPISAVMIDPSSVPGDEGLDAARAPPDCPRITCRPRSSPWPSPGWRIAAPAASGRCCRRGCR